jgi:toxin ParE1/3/4
LIRQLNRLPAAERDLDDIYIHIAADSIKAADGVLMRILDAERRLIEFPEIGQARPDLRAGLRHWVVGNFLILYRTDDDAITVVRVVHGARDLRGLLDD